jgi:hypothetical protein
MTAKTEKYKLLKIVERSRIGKISNAAGKSSD